MFKRCSCVLTALAALAAATVRAGESFATEVPPLVLARLTATNEVRGAFVQTKRLPTGEVFVSRGEYRIRPGRDFEWMVLDPFVALFSADLETYVYSNEDERVEKPLKDLPHVARIMARLSGGGEPDFGEFFRAFDALYKEEPEGVFHVLAKPKEPRLARVLSRVEADGTPTNWVLRATFPDRASFEIEFRE